MLVAAGSCRGGVRNTDKQKGIPSKPAFSGFARIACMCQVIEGVVERKQLAPLACRIQFCATDPTTVEALRWLIQEHYTARSDLEEGPSSYPCTSGVKKSFAAKNLANSPEHPCRSKEVWGRPRLLCLLHLVQSSQVLHHCLALVSDISHQMPWRSFRVQLLAGRPCSVRPIDQDCRKPQNVSIQVGSPDQSPHSHQTGATHQCEGCQLDFQI